MDIPYLSVSYFFACISLTCWLCAQFPQVIQNFRNKSTNGLSINFLLIWLLGDCSNFIGCILTKQLAFQFLLASYYVIVDIILCSQYYYYTFVFPKQEKQRLYNNNIGIGNNYSYGSCPIQIPIIEGVSIEDPSSSLNLNVNTNIDSNAKKFKFLPNSVSSVIFTTLTTLSNTVHSAPVYTDIKIINTISVSNTPQIIGLILSWVCTVSYLSSRLPQIIKNHKRKSTKGLSSLLFSAALLGNLTYVISILLIAPTTHSPYDFIKHESPYLLGSGGTIIFDIIILFQTAKYNNNDYNYNYEYNYSSFTNQISNVNSPVSSKSLSTE